MWCLVAVNIPLRDYQLNITRTALFSNTLVALPTGLGKTLIAAVVMYNYFRWFPEGRIMLCNLLYLCSPFTWYWWRTLILLSFRGYYLLLSRRHNFSHHVYLFIHLFPLSSLRWWPENSQHCLVVDCTNFTIYLLFRFNSIFLYDFGWKMIAFLILGHLWLHLLLNAKYANRESWSFLTWVNDLSTVHCLKWSLIRNSIFEQLNTLCFCTFLVLLFVHWKRVVDKHAARSEACWRFLCASWNCECTSSLCGKSLILVLGTFMVGKIVFAAPSRPLVLQQIEACHNVVGIPQVRQLWHLTCYFFF